MNTAPTSWTGDGLLILNNENCPNPYTYCWSFNSPSNISRVDSTEGFNDVQLTYSIAISGSDGVNICLIQYSTDSTNFYDIERLKTDYSHIAFTNIFTAKDWAHSADNIAALTIRLSYIGSGHNCYFNEFKLEGTPITANPTFDPTKAPTTAPSNSPSAPPSKSPSNSPTTAPSVSPSQSPTADPSDAPTLAPTPSPTYTAPFITENCHNDSFTRCYYVNIAPIPGEVETRTISIQQEYLGYFSQYYEIYVIPEGFDCIDPSISLDYEPIDYDYDSEYLQVFIASNTSIIKCGGVLDQCNVWTSCLSHYNLGINTLELDQESLLITIMKSREVHASCASYHNYAISVQLTIICSNTPATAVPTSAPTTNPTSATSTSSIVMFIISNQYNNAHNYSLILMIKNYDYISTHLDLFLSSPINTTSIISISELTDYSYCVESVCIQFFSVVYTAQCQSVLNGGSGLILNGEWKAQFTTRCKDDEDMNRIQCVDKIGNDSNKMSIQNSNDFVFEDQLCIDSLYFYTFTADITYYNSNFSSKTKVNAKYTEGDTVYIEMEINGDLNYTVNAITIDNVFGCVTTSTVLSESETQNGMGGCLLAQSQYDVESNASDGRFWFKIPKGVQSKDKSTIFNVQIQTILSISVSRFGNTTISNQVRHFMINVVLDDLTEPNHTTGRLIVIIIVIVCIFIVMVVNIINITHNQNKENIVPVQPRDQNEENEFGADEEKSEEKHEHALEMTERKEASERSTDNICCICFIDAYGYAQVQEQMFVIKPCRHVLHLQCATDWMTHCDNCPQCWTQISNMDTIIETFL